MKNHFSNFSDDDQEERVEDSFDFFQPKKTKFEDENDFQLSNTHKKAAKLFAAKIVKDAGILSAPVEIEVILNFLKVNTKYNIGIERTKSFSDRLSAQTIKVSEPGFESSTIVLNDNQHSNRQRFSFAHELGHIYFNTFHKDSNQRNMNHEKDADFFASELMIPTFLIKEDLKKCKVVGELAKKYEVSKDAMFIKIQSPDLLKYL